MVSSNEKLCIYTLGEFRVTRGERVLAGEDDRPKKRWLFFQILLTYQDAPPPRDKLLAWLNLKESISPWNALKSLVYYLRQNLKKGASNTEEQYIVNNRGLYSFNREADYWFDAEHFKTLCEKAGQLLSSGAHEEAVHTYREAFTLYQGDYLMEVGSKSWAVRPRTQYKRIFLESVKTTIQVLLDSKHYEEAWELCEQGMQVAMLEEELHQFAIRALLEAGKPGLARIQYEEAVSIFRTHDLELSTDTQKLGEQLTTIPDSTEDPQLVLKELQNRELETGALECGMTTFAIIYDLEKRRSERREGAEPYLVHLRIEPEDCTQTIEQDQELLREVLKDNLRKGDVICSWGERNIILLLSDIEPEHTTIVMKRIEALFDSLSMHSAINVKYHPQKL